MLGKKKNKVHSEINDKYLLALKNKKIPLLTLDARWHQLFPEYRKNGEIRQKEKTLNRLIKKQGQTSNDLKEYEKAKRALMDNIMENMTDGHEFDSRMRSRKQDRNQQLMEELKDKIMEAEFLQESIPKEIIKANQELLIACMGVCYEELMENTATIEEQEELIAQMREELKNHILIKQDKEMRNTEMYKFMHNLLGAQVVEVFDREHKVWRGNLEETGHGETKRVPEKTEQDEAKGRRQI